MAQPVMDLAVRRMLAATLCAALLILFPIAGFFSFFAMISSTNATIRTQLSYDIAEVYFWWSKK